MSISSTSKVTQPEEKSHRFNLAHIWDKFGMLLVFAGLFFGSSRISGKLKQKR